MTTLWTAGGSKCHLLSLSFQTTTTINKRIINIRRISTNFHKNTNPHKKQRASSTNNGTIRHGSSNISASPNKVKINTSTTNHEPPLPIRTLLVSSSTALCTPSFPVIGFVNLILRIAVPDPNLRSHLSGSIGSILSFATWTLLPLSYQLAPAMIPFALGNGLCAGSAYVALDKLSGGPNSKLMRNPIFCGGGIGAFTGYVAPNYCYGPAFYTLYGVEGVDQSIRTVMSVPLFSEISTATGFVAGVAMYPLLHYPIYGIKDIPWYNLSGVALLLTASMSYYIYSPNNGEDDVLPVPDGAFVSREMVPLLDSVVRYDVESGDFRTFSLSTNRWMGPTNDYEKGSELARDVRSYGGDTFDDRMLAWMSILFDEGVKGRYPHRVVSVRTSANIEECEDFFLKTDWVVRYILDRAGARTASKSESKEHNIDEEMKYVPTALYRRTRNRKIKQMEEVSVAVELFMTLKYTTDGRQAHKHSTLMEELKVWIKKKAPGILLTKDDEGGNAEGIYKSQSIESQLDRMKWTAGDLAPVMDKWKHHENKRLRKKALVTTGLLVASLGGLTLAF